MTTTPQKAVRGQPLVKATVKDGKVSLQVECEAGDAGSLGLGEVSAPFAEYLVGQLASLSVSGDLPDGPLNMSDTNALLRLAASIQPQSAFEAALSVQMAMLHHMALDCGRRALNRGATMEGRALNVAHAGKLSRSYAMLLDALSRHRGKTTSQTVRVEHVTIHGGQTVVGAVAGVGGNRKHEVQPHGHETTGATEGGAGARARGPALPSAQPIGRAVPTAGDEGEEALPDARRRRGKRRAKGKQEPLGSRKLQRTRGGRAANDAQVAGKGSRSNKGVI